MSDVVKSGDPITARGWNQMIDAIGASQVLRGGDDTRVSRYPHGSFINSKVGGGYTHPWRVITSSLAAFIRPGTINGQYPNIRTSDGELRPMNDTPPPLLDFTSTSIKVGLNNVGWIALELKVKEDYRTIDTAEVVQCDFIVGSEKATNNPFLFFGLPGIGNFKVRYPLARLQFRPETLSTDIFQVAMFNLNMISKPPPQETDPGGRVRSSLPRYFFFPA